MSQADVAREMAERGWDWHQSTCYKVEKGERRTEASESYDLARILGVPLDRLFWPGPEQSALALVDSAAVALRRNYDETASAVVGLLGVRTGAAQVLGQTRDSTYDRVRQAAADLAADLEENTLEAAVQEGIARDGDEADG